MEQQMDRRVAIKGLAALFACGCGSAKPAWAEFAAKGCRAANAGHTTFPYRITHNASPWFGEAHDRLSELFEVRPGLSFYDDSDGASALATTAFYQSVFPSIDGTVLLGLRLIQEEMARGDMTTVFMVMAHEFAHILQYKRGLMDGPWQWSRTLISWLAGR